jgi:Calx-beta domain
MRFAIAASLAALSLLAPAGAHAAPTLSIDDVSITEGDTGQKTAQFTVTTSETSASPITVNYATADDTAKQPDDYTQTSGLLTIPPGMTSNTILVPVKGDTVDEPDENFDVNLSSAAGATISDSQGVGTIKDDDGAPSLSVNDVSRSETNGPLTFTVKLSKASGQDVSVHFATADGSAHAPGDYTATSGAVTIPAGSTSKTVAVQLREDTLDEPNETFTLNLSSSTNAPISDNSGRGTINDDDSAPSMSIRDASVREGGTVGFAVVLSRPSGRTITVRFATEARTAQANVDYSTTSGTLTIPAGATGGTVLVPSRQDRRDEPSETFLVRLSRAANARLSDSSGQGTIVDDDPPPNARPRVTALGLAPFAFRAARRGGPTGTRGGTRVHFFLSERAVVTFRVQRRLRNGRFRNVAGAFSRTRSAGFVSLHFRGRIGGHRLAPGRYRLVVVARDALGAKSFVRRAGFRITS